MKKIKDEKKRKIEFDRIKDEQRVTSDEDN